MNIDEIAKEAAEKMMNPKLKDISVEAYDLQLKAFTTVVKEACLKSLAIDDGLNEDEVIEDGFGSVWLKRCPECGEMSMEVVRPGKAQCSHCG